MQHASNAAASTHFDEWIPLASDVKGGICSVVGNAAMRMMADCFACDATPPQVCGAVELSTERLAFATAAGAPLANAPPVLLLEVFSDCNSFMRVASKRGRAQVPECVSWRNGRDLRKWDHQRQVLRLIRKLRPEFVILAFPCTAWSQIANLNHNNEKLRESRWGSGGQARLVKFAVRVAREQMRAGRSFVMENPVASAAWWMIPSMVQLRKVCFEVRMDQCAVGLDVGFGLVRKRTRFVTNSQAVVRKLAPLQCDHSHQHAHCIGGSKITAACGRYLHRLVLLLVEAFEEHIGAKLRPLERSPRRGDSVDVLSSEASSDSDSSSEPRASLQLLR